jgi:SNF2 family DNA or RNA helicase
LLGWKISYDAFQTVYVNWKKIMVGGFPQKIVDKADPYKNVERLKSKMREYGAVFKKTEEVIDLPAQQFIEVKVKKNSNYSKFMKQSFVAFKNHDQELELIGDTTLTKKLYARQLCGAYSSDKLQAFKDLIESTNERLIVFYNFNNELEELVKVCSDCDKPISQVNGSVKDLTAYEAYDNSVTLVQYQAGAMGLNLQKSNRIIYYTPCERSELFEQSKKRIHRIGQEKPCYYYLMICEKTVEEQIYETLKKRKDYTDDLFKSYKRTDS